MAKFIEISTKNDDLLLVNVSHIAYVQKEESGATIVLSVDKNELKEIKTQQNYIELKKLLKN
jgi:hypothetical protein